MWNCQPRSIAIVAAGLWLNASILLADVTVRGRILDDATNEPVAARIYLQAADGTWHFPKSASPEGTAIDYRRPRSDRVQEMHVTLSAHPFTATIPAGKFTVTVERGKEYVPLIKEFTGTDGETVDIALRLKRWIHMAKRGWYSADMHIHRPLAEIPNVVLAEDLNLAFPMSHWVQGANDVPKITNIVKDPSPPPAPITVDPDHLIYPLNTEYEIFKVGGKPHTLGAVLILGQRTVFDRGVPPIKHIAKQAHAEGALLDLEKHSWPWSAAIVPVMNVDLFELANNHVWRTEFGFPKWTLEAASPHMNLEMDDQGFTEWGWIEFGFKTYYGLLNCGLKLKPNAGTASGVHPVPAGFGRVYVHVPEKFTYENWFAGLKAGRCFVTTGPMLDVRFNDRHPGEEFASQETFPCRITGIADSLLPLDRIEILVNGDVVQTLSPDNAARDEQGFRSRIVANVRLDRTGWIAVRCFERHPKKRIRFAHTAPVHVTIPGKPQRPKKADVDYFIEMVQRELKRNTGVLPETALDEYREALKFYEDQLQHAE